MAGSRSPGRIFRHLEASSEAGDTSIDVLLCTNIGNANHASPKLGFRIFAPRFLCQIEMARTLVFATAWSFENFYEETALAFGLGDRFTG